MMMTTTPVIIETAPPLPWYRFSNNEMLQAYVWLICGRSFVLMSNVYLATALVTLATQQAGCATTDNCKVYGFSPGALIANVTVVSGLVTAFCMPILGAMIDYTDHRHRIGVWGARGLLVIQAVQIGLGANTWLAVAVLQAGAGFLYFVQILVCYAYLSRIRRALGEAVLNRHLAYIQALQAAISIAFLLVVSGCSIVGGYGDVATARLSQGLNVLLVTPCFVVGWRRMPPALRSHALEPSQSIWKQGFIQLGRTIRTVRQNHRPLFWFNLSIAFAEAGANAVLALAPTYLDEHVGLSAAQVGLAVLCVLICMIPGSWLSSAVPLEDPNSSWRWSMGFLILVVSGGSYLVDILPTWSAYIWTSAAGLALGWFYPTETLIFASLAPRHSETEMSGLFAYCNQILAWAPALVYSALVEANVRRTYSFMSIGIFFGMGVVLNWQCGVWKEIAKEDETKCTTEEEP